MLVSLFEQFEAHTHQFFTDIYRLVALTACTDAYNVRSGDFCADDDNGLIALPLAHARRVKIATSKYSCMLTVQMPHTNTVHTVCHTNSFLPFHSLVNSQKTANYYLQCKHHTAGISTA